MGFQDELKPIWDNINEDDIGSFQRTKQRDNTCDRIVMTALYEPETSIEKE